MRSVFVATKQIEITHVGGSNTAGRRLESVG